MQKSKTKLFNGFCVATIVLLLIFITFFLLPEYKIYKGMKQKVDRLTNELQINENKYLELNSIIYKLEKDPRMIEKVARNKYNLCKKGDIIFNVKKK